MNQTAKFACGFSVAVFALGAGFYLGRQGPWSHYDVAVPPMAEVTQEEQEPPAPGSSTLSHDPSSRSSKPGQLIQVALQSSVKLQSGSSDIPWTKVRVTARGQHFQATETRPDMLVLPAEVFVDGPPRLWVDMPGWYPKELLLEPAGESYEYKVTLSIVLEQRRGSLSLSMPRVGADYDLAELAWVRSREGEDISTPPAPLVIKLDFKGQKTVENIPIGVYSLVLKSEGTGLIKDFVLSPELEIGESNGDTGSQLPTVQRSIPPSLGGTYVAFVNTSRNATNQAWMGAYIGLRLNVRKGTGTLMIAYQEMRRDQRMTFAALRPRPDNVWSVTNVWLVDPTQVEFDCPFYHVDHHYRLTAADGVFSLHGRIGVEPESASLTQMMQSRMWTLLQGQVRQAAQNPAGYDPGFARLPMRQMPAYQYLHTREAYEQHLRNMTFNPLKALELGTEVIVRQAGAQEWDAEVRFQAADR